MRVFSIVSFTRVKLQFLYFIYKPSYSWIIRRFTVF